MKYLPEIVTICGNCCNLSVVYMSAYRLSPDLCLLSDCDVYKVFVMFHVTGIFMYIFFDIFKKKIL
jgi:hypothetical protein